MPRKSIAKLNIEHFEKLLDSETNEAELHRLRDLLADEKAKLDKIIAAASKTPKAQ